MKGILYKDLLLAWKNMKYLLLAFAFFALALVSQSPQSRAMMVGMYLCLVGVLTPLYTFSYDRAARWDVYARSLPLKRWQIVLSKYLLGVLFFVCGLGLGGCLAVVVGFGSTAAQAGQLFASLAGMILVGLLILSIELPVFYRFGPEKARLIIILVIFMLASLLGASISFRETEGIDLLLFVLNQSPVLPFLFAGLIVFIGIGSFFLSVRIYSKRGE